MTTTSHHPDEQLLLLLADRALGEIDEQDAALLEDLLSVPTGQREAEAMDAAAAAAQLAMLGTADEVAVPARVRARLDAAASEWLRTTEAGGDSLDRALGNVQAHSGVAQPIPLPVGAGATPRAGRNGIAAWSGWLAAAACLVLALIAWTQSGTPRTSEPTMAERFSAMVATPGVVRVGWSAGPDDPLADPEALDGEVVWDPQSQRGYMRIAGLRANDASREQYQLWVFDATRDDAHPVDGGVFDVRPDEKGEAIVAFTPRVPVREATLFAVTVEQPGGVVVSKRERLPILAQVAGK